MRADVKPDGHGRLARHQRFLPQFFFIAAYDLSLTVDFDFGRDVPAALRRLMLWSKPFFAAMSALPPSASSLAALASPASGARAEGLLSWTALWLRSLEVRPSLAVVLGSALRSEPSALRHWQLLAATDGKAWTALARHQQRSFGKTAHATCQASAPSVNAIRNCPSVTDRTPTSSEPSSSS